MDYIIDPMWFYWLSVVDNLTTVALIVAVVTGVTIGVVSIFLFLDDTNIFKGHLILGASGVLLFIASVIALIFIPSKQTLIEMEIAKHATYSNVESVKEQIKDATDYILDRLEGKENK